MYRVIYCPNQDFLDTATLLSKDNNLSILIGDNDYTKNLSFNRDIVSIIKIPEHKEINTLQNVKKDFHQIIIYINEFLNIKDKIKLYINDIEIKSLYEESHNAKFLYLCKDIGEKDCKILINNQVEEEFSFVVN